MKYGVSNALIQATSNKANVAGRMTYGFRNGNTGLPF